MRLYNIYQAVPRFLFRALFLFRPPAWVLYNETEFPWFSRCWPNDSTVMKSPPALAERRRIDWNSILSRLRNGSFFFVFFVSLCFSTIYLVSLSGQGKSKSDKARLTPVLELKVRPIILFGVVPSSCNWFLGSYRCYFFGDSAEFSFGFLFRPLEIGTTWPGL